MSSSIVNNKSQGQIFYKHKNQYSLSLSSELDPSSGILPGQKKSSDGQVRKYKMLQEFYL